jgi:hypothetical protein
MNEQHVLEHVGHLSAPAWATDGGPYRYDVR